MICIEGLSVHYGEEAAIENLSLAIPSRQTCAIIGPSGCGKTTLLYVLARLIPPGSGTVTIDGDKGLAVRKKSGLVFQNGGLLPWKTAWDNAALGLAARGRSEPEIKAILSPILEELAILDHGHKFPKQLSAGQKQRFAIARTLATAPDLLLLDEASAALDALSKEQLQDMILNIYKRNSLTMVLVTHSIEEAVFLGQNIVVMKRGGIKKILKNPYFGDAGIRTKPQFFHLCLGVRRCLCDEDERLEQ